MADNKPLVGIIMGSQSDWPTMKNAADTLDKLGIANEMRVISAHRTPHRLTEYATEARDNGLKVLIAGAGMAAALPGAAAALTPSQFWACLWKAKSWAVWTPCLP